MLSAMSTVQTQIDSTIKQEVDNILSERGISISDAMRLILMQIAKNKSFPFDDIVPNQETLDAMNEVENHQLLSFDSVDDLLKDL